MNYYKTTDDWINYNGYDLVPDVTDNAPYNLAFYKLGYLNKTSHRMNLQSGRCILDGFDGGTWIIDRVGPFKSIGGYDWWQFAWDNVFDLHNVIQHYPEGVYITNHFTGGISANGSVLGFPPIHVHHVHVSPRYNQVYRICRYGPKKYCTHQLHVVFEQHGDYQCSHVDGGVRCLLEDMPAGYARLVKGPLTINGELNDVRPAGSEPLEVWYQIAIRFVPKRSRQDRFHPLSFHYMWSPGRLDIFDQSTMVNTLSGTPGRCNSMPLLSVARCTLTIHFLTTPFCLQQLQQIFLNPQLFVKILRHTCILTSSSSH